MTEKPDISQKVIIILEHLVDVNEYLEIRSQIPGTHIVIATIPDVCWELEKRNIQYKGIEIYFNSKKIYDTGMKNYEIVENLCFKIDSMLQESTPFLKKNSLKPAFDNYYYIKKLFDNLTLRIIIIKSIIEHEKPSKIIAFSSDKGSPNDYISPFDFHESIYSLLLDNNCWNLNIIHLQKKNQEPVNESECEGCRQSSVSYRLKLILKSLKNQFKNKATVGTYSSAKCNRLYQFILTLPILIKNKHFNFSRNLLGNRDLKTKDTIGNNKTLFLFRVDPSWNAMLNVLYQQGFKILNLSEISNYVSRESETEILQKNHIVEIIQNFCSHQHINISHILIGKILPVLENYLICAPEIVQSINLEIDKYNPLAFLSSEKSLCIELIYSHIAHSRNIPVIAWQHGDGPFYPPMQIFVEISDSDIHMSYGPGHQAMIRAASHNHFDTQIESVGSLILEKLYFEQSGNRHKHKILYVTSQFYYNHYYINLYPTPDNTLWHYQKTILNLLGNLHIPVIFKLMPQEYETPLFSEYITKKGFNNITLIHYERSFLDLLNDADIVICDYPSTPVIEAIAARKIIFVLLDSPFLSKEALELLKKRVYWSDNIEEFVKIIFNYLNEKPINQNPDIKNTEYLEKYGVHKLDGKVSERALKIIEKAI